LKSKKIPFNFDFEISKYCDRWFSYFKADNHGDLVFFSKHTSDLSSVYMYIVYTVYAGSHSKLLQGWKLFKENALMKFIYLKKKKYIYIVYLFINLKKR
jgi:hypothetical protein